MPNDPFAQYQKPTEDPFSKYQQPLVVSKKTGFEPIPKSGMNPYATDTLIEGLKNTGPDALPAIGGTLGGIPGAAVGTAGKQILQNIAPSVYGKPSVTNAAIDFAVNGLIPEGLGKIVSSAITSLGAKTGLRGFLANLIPEGIAKNLPATKIAQTINGAKDFIKPESEIAAEFPKELQFPKNQTYKEVPFDTSKVLNSVEDVLKAKTLNPIATEKLALSDLMTKNFSPSGDTFNPSKILDELGKNEVYKKAISPEALGTFKQLMETAQKQGIGQKMTPATAMFYEGKRLVIGGIVGHLIGLPPTVTGGVILGHDALSHIASDPKLGQLIIQAMKTPAGDSTAPIIGKAIANGLRGTTAFIRIDGKKEPVTFGENGLEYQKP